MQHRFLSLAVAATADVQAAVAIAADRPVVPMAMSTVVAAVQMAVHRAGHLLVERLRPVHAVFVPPAFAYRFRPCCGIQSIFSLVCKVSRDRPIEAGRAALVSMKRSTGVSQCHVYHVHRYQHNLAFAEFTVTSLDPRSHKTIAINCL